MSRGDHLLRRYGLMRLIELATVQQGAALLQTEPNAAAMPSTPITSTPALSG